MGHDDAREGLAEPCEQNHYPIRGALNGVLHLYMKGGMCVCGGSVSGSTMALGATVFHDTYI